MWYTQCRYCSGGKLISIQHTLYLFFLLRLLAENTAFVFSRKRSWSSDSFAELPTWFHLRGSWCESFNFGTWIFLHGIRRRRLKPLENPQRTFYSACNEIYLWLLCAKGENRKMKCFLFRNVFHVCILDFSHVCSVQGTKRCTFWYQVGAIAPSALCAKNLI